LVSLSAGRNIAISASDAVAVTSGACTVDDRCVAASFAGRLANEVDSRL